MWKVLVFLMISWCLWADEAHPVLPLGSAAPNFELPGVDGRSIRLARIAASPILVVVFTCNHCPIAQVYERRIETARMTTYKDRA